MSEDIQCNLGENLIQSIRDKDSQRAITLLDEGANVNQKESGAMTNPSVLILASRFGLTDVVARLLKGGANPNIADDWGGTPLSASSEGGYNDITLLLLNAGADVNSQGAGGQTPLMMACIYGRTEIVKLLLAHGADLGIRERYEIGSTRASGDLYNA